MSKPIKKIFIDPSCDTPTPPEQICPIKANVIESCNSDNTITLEDGSTIFNKVIVGETDFIIGGKILQYNNENIDGKILIGTPSGFSLDYLANYSGRTNSFTSNDNSLTITESGLTFDFSVNVSNEIVDGDQNPVEGGVIYNALLAKESLPTGFIAGLELSINPFDNTKVDIAPGAYSITDYSDLLAPTVSIKQVPNGITGITPQYLLTSNASYIALDADMNVVQSASPFDNADRRSLAIIGAAIHSNLTNVNITNEIKAPIIAPTNQLHDFIRAIGALNLTGNLYSPNGSNLMIDKSAGQIWGLGINGGNYLDPHRLNISDQTQLTFRYRLKDSTEFPDTQFIDPNNYDSFSGLTSVPTGKFTIQHINLFQSGLTRIQYGQNLYDTMSDAKGLVQLESFDVEDNIADNSIFRAFLIIKEGTSDLASGVTMDEVEFIPVDKFGNVIGGAGFSLNYNDVIVALGYTPENEANKTDDIETNKTSSVLYTSAKAVVNWVKDFLFPNLPEKSTLVDTDQLALGDSSDSNKTKKITWSNFKALFKTIGGVSIFGGGDIPTISGGGTINYVPKWNTTTGLTNSIIYDDGTNVGIGTIAPTKKLDVNGDALINGLTIGRGAGNASNNTAVGTFALFYNTSGGTANTALGYQTLAFNTTGDNNTAVGYNSLLNNISGSFNVAVGYRTLVSSSGGTYNTSVGYRALQANTTGLANTAYGAWTLQANTTGQFNMAIGYSTLFNNTTGIKNNAFGVEAMYSNTTGQFNTAVGQESLRANTSGSNNTAVGTFTLLHSTTGSTNIAFGENAGRFISGAVTPLTNVNNSLFLGYQTQALANGSTNEIVIGNNAIGNGSNSVTLGNDSITKTVLKGNSLIGTTTDNGVDKLQINGSAISTAWKTSGGTPTQTLMGDGSLKYAGTIIKTRKDITGTSYTLLSSDVDKILYTTSASGVTITIPVGLTPNQEYEVIQYGDGQVSYVESGTTLRFQDYELASHYAKYSRVSITYIDTETYQLLGQLTMI